MPYLVGGLNILRKKNKPELIKTEFPPKQTEFSKQGKHSLSVGSNEKCPNLQT